MLTKPLATPNFFLIQFSFPYSRIEMWNSHCIQAKEQVFETNLSKLGSYSNSSGYSAKFSNLGQFYKLN